MTLYEIKASNAYDKGSETSVRLLSGHGRNRLEPWITEYLSRHEDGKVKVAVLSKRGRKYKRRLLFTETNQGRIWLKEGYGMKACKIAIEAKKHEIFALILGGSIDFMDEKSGKSLGIWFAKPYPRFIINGMQQSGGPFQALARIVKSRNHHQGRRFG